MGVSLLVAGVSCLAFFFDVSAAFESIGTDRVPIFDRPVSGRETLSQLVFVLALHFVQHLPPSLPFSVLALSLLRISIIPDPTGSPWMPMTVRGCVPLCMYLDNEKCVYGILLRRVSCSRVDRHGYLCHGSKEPTLGLVAKKIKFCRSYKPIT